MSKKHTIKKTAALLLGLALTFGATGCDFIVSDSEKDLLQVVAEVDITKILKDDEDFKEYTDVVSDIIDDADGLSKIYKRDLIAAFLNVGYTYVNSYGYSYEDTFNMLMKSLANQKIFTQYAIAYYSKKAASQSGETSYEAFLNAQLQDAEMAAIYEKNPEILRLKYYLTDFGKTDEESMKDYNVAVYSLKKSLNDALDSAEANYIKEDDEEHEHGDSRTMPTNVDAEKEDYYAVDYDIYTGRNALTSCGEAYEKVDGSTPTTRKKAYNAFLSNLQSYGLVGKDEDTSKITGLDYYYEELSSALAQALVSKYNEELNEVAQNGLTFEKAQEKYEKLFADQKTVYTKDEDAFATALDSVSDEKFVLYGQKNFGFVYNILIPFSSSQDRAYTAAKSKLANDENGVFNARKAILKQVEAEDLRSAWFYTEDDVNYSYVATGNYYENGLNKGDKTYLFFENNTIAQGDRYESLTQYAGQYPYNGVVVEGEDEGDFEFTPNKLGINQFISEMEAYIEEVSGAKATGNYNEAAYESDNAKATYVDSEGETDWSKFVYYKGSVALDTFNAAYYFKRDTQAYKALSAVNELMFAYSTDTGCLNTYMGYVVSPYKTNFVSEFEYAAQIAVLGGVGTYVVVPSDYGWHIIYCSFVYDGSNDGKVYGEFNEADMSEEGTLSYLFYESLKSSTASNYTTEMQEILLEEYKDSATYYTKAYQDLLDMDE